MSALLHTLDELGFMRFYIISYGPSSLVMILFLLGTDSSFCFYHLSPFLLLLPSNNASSSGPQKWVKNLAVKQPQVCGCVLLGWNDMQPQGRTN